MLLDEGNEEKRRMLVDLDHADKILDVDIARRDCLVQHSTSPNCP